MSAFSKVLKKAISSFKKESGRVLSVAQDEQGNVAPTGELPKFPREYRVTRLSTELQVNAALRTILGGVIGFDTEFTDRTPTKEEQIIIDYYPHAAGVRKQAMTGCR
ncbi:hypothetical protein C8F04DRAFT_1254477 [Mycena alexandri]|uniref:Uncharacterized protein n=1 Tax=Mycena alexandri TaxID=1745969 RepID=A0AAD6T6H2_9AGAR|nr:hypothetical protein C8F04DRAFT_1254477 [Mycena alexandri]